MDKDDVYTCDPTVSLERVERQRAEVRSTEAGAQDAEGGPESIGVRQLAAFECCRQAAVAGWLVVEARGMNGLGKEGRGAVLEDLAEMVERGVVCRVAED